MANKKPALAFAKRVRNSTRALAVFVTRPQAVVKSARSWHATPGTLRCQSRGNRTCAKGLFGSRQVQIQLGNVRFAPGQLIVVALRLDSGQVLRGNVAGDINAVET